MPRSRSAASASKRKSSDTSFLSKLQMLRDFVGSNVDEKDLSACLRQCGLNVELAAERLITGQYSKNHGASFFATNAKTPSNHNKRPRTVQVSTAKKTPAAAAKKTPTPPTAATTQANYKTPALKTPALLKSTTTNDNRLWLCCRWVVGTSTTKLGRVCYKETLAITHSLTGPSMVRFRGARVEGTLRPNLAALLTPLLRQEKPLLHIEAEALMDEQGIPIGGDVPVSLTIYLDEPRSFFGLFANESSAKSSSARSQFFGGKNKRGRPRKTVRCPLVEAAYCLLQWAEYGDDPTFEPPTSNDQDEGTKLSDDEDTVVEDSELNGDNEEENEMPEFAKSVVDTAMKLPEASDPVGFKDNVVLRPYQKQALHWMMKRESGQDDRDELEAELTLLAELSQQGLRPPVETPTEGIVCEVGPVRVSPSMAAQSHTLSGVQNPVNHPLWQRRFLASPDKESVISFYVNELLGIASSEPPNPPRQCVGGMLCDAMGLGKTVMLLALILKDKEVSENAMDEDEVVIVDEEGLSDEKPRGGTTLVVAPLSLVSQWEEELATKTDLKHRVYYGDTAKGGIHANAFSGIDVVVTTYGTIQAELLSASKGKTKDQGLIPYDWYRVILDEAHCVKNPGTVVSRACCALKANKRWCVTGTPIQNSLQDVYALLKFLRHEPWCEFGFWKAAINSALETGGGDEAMPANANGGQGEPIQEAAGSSVALSRVKRLLAPLILRRTKDTLTEDGQPILTLPPVEDVTVNVELSVTEREFYNSLLSKSQEVFEGFIEAGTASKSWFQIFSLLNRLRQACDHVALTVKSHMEDADWNPAVTAEAGADKKKSASPAVAKAKKSPSEKDAIGDEFLESLLEKFRTKQATDKENVETSYASHVAHALTQTVQSSAATIEDECPICLDCPPICEAVITPCAHIFCRECLIGILKKNASSSKEGTIEASLEYPNGTCPSCNETIDSKRIIVLSKTAEDGRVTTSYLASSEKVVKNVAMKSEPMQDSAHLAARQTLENALRGAVSSKLTAVVQELHNVWEKDPQSKVLIFSQYLGFLDLLESSLRNGSIPCGRLDGKMTLSQRVNVLDKFRQDTPNQSNSGNDERKNRIGSVLLMSMKAGGVGINMVAASSVFIVDRWWNAAVEDQCVNRIHRIGQMAELVRVRKFVVTDSVEEKIVMLQRRKKDMASEVLSDVNSDGALSNSAPTLEDFKLLFGGS